MFAVANIATPSVSVLENVLGASRLHTTCSHSAFGAISRKDSEDNSCAFRKFRGWASNDISWII